jgi:macrolide transport system ATP-binding/permease protein
LADPVVTVPLPIGPRADPAAFVELRGVTRSYPTGTVALADVDLRLDRGESVAITGRSGSGKSTLLNVLGLLDVPTAGELVIDGRRVEADSDRRRSERRSADLGFVFQRSHLIPALSARQNVLLGLRYSNCPEDRSEQAAEEALAAVGLAAKVDALARTLSGGEMQRVAIARTLARPAQLWLADEPTGNLDSTQSVEIIELLKLRAAERGACLVVVTHEPDIAARMDRVVTLRDGRVVADTGVPSTDLLLGTDLASNEKPQSPSYRSRARRTARFIAQGVAAHPRRAWSGILAAAIAVALTVAALGLAQSASAQVTSLFDAQRATQVTARIGIDPQTAPRWPIQLDAVQSFSGVTGAEYWRTREGIPMTNGSLVADTATVIEVDAAPGAATDSTVDWAANDDHVLGDGEVLLGSLLADRLAIGQPDLNPEITVDGTRLRVVGLLTTSRAGTAGGAAFVTSASVTGLPASTAAELYIETVPGAARDVADRLPDLADPYRTTTMHVDPVLAADSYRGQLEDSVSASLQVLAVVAALAGLIAVVFVNILSVGARTAEFGVRRAFGARRSELISLVVGESTVLGLLGAALGLAAGFTAVMVVTALARWQPVFDLRLLLVPLFGALVFGTLGGLPPAIAAGRIQPADAVRT